MSSEPNSPFFISSDEEAITRTMGDVIKCNYTEELIDYLQRNDLKLNEAHIEIFRRKEIDGLTFLKLTEENFKSLGFQDGPVIKLENFIKDIKEKKLRPFSSYKTVEELKEVLRKYKVNDEKIENIKQFCPGM